MKVYENNICREMTPEEIAALEQTIANQQPNVEERISALKQKLSSTDYQAIKYAEGWISDEEYASIKAQRQEWRDEINRLEVENVC